MNIEEARAALKEAEKVEAAKRDAVKAATPVVMQYTIAPVDTNSFRDEVYDNTCRVYTLQGTVANLEEAKAAGHDNYRLRSGGMNYVFNTVTGKMVMAVGGGTIYISRNFYAKRDGADGSDVQAMDEINEFLALSPDGGDITDIVLRHQARRNKK